MNANRDSRLHVARHVSMAWGAHCAAATWAEVGDWIKVRVQSEGKDWSKAQYEAIFAGQGCPARDRALMGDPRALARLATIYAFSSAASGNERNLEEALGAAGSRLGASDEPVLLVDIGAGTGEALRARPEDRLRRPVVYVPIDLDASRLDMLEAVANDERSVSHLLRLDKARAYRDAYGDEPYLEPFMDPTTSRVLDLLASSPATRDLGCIIVLVSNVWKSILNHPAQWLRTTLLSYYDLVCKALGTIVPGMFLWIDRLNEKNPNPKYKRARDFLEINEARGARVTYPCPDGKGCPRGRLDPTSLVRPSSRALRQPAQWSLLSNGRAVEVCRVGTRDASAVSIHWATPDMALEPAPTFVPREQVVCSTAGWTP